MSTSFDDVDRLRGLFQTHRATSADSPYDFARQASEHAPRGRSKSPTTRRPPVAGGNPVWLDDVAERRHRRLQKRPPHDRASPARNANTPQLQPRVRENPWATGWTPDPSPGPSPPPVTSPRSPDRRVAITDWDTFMGASDMAQHAKAAQVADGSVPSLKPSLRTPQGGVREGDNWHSHEAIRDERQWMRGHEHEDDECFLKSS